MNSPAYDYDRPPRISKRDAVEETWAADNLTTTQRLLLLYMIRVADEFGCCYVDRSLMVRTVRCSLPTVVKDLKHLTAEGHLTRERLKGMRGFRYVYLVHPRHGILTLSA